MKRCMRAVRMLLCHKCVTFSLLHTLVWRADRWIAGVGLRLRDRLEGLSVFEDGRERSRGEGTRPQ